MINNVVNIFDKTKEKNMLDILSSFGIRVDNISLEEKNNFDIYDISLSRGTRVSKLSKILEDVGMHVGAYSVPTGGVSTKDGVYRLHVQKHEIPSSDFSAYKAALADGLFSNMTTPIPIGVDYCGEILCVDLATLPNLLIGGVPGSGKSMLLHSILLSLLHNKSKLYLADPKRVEFSLYERKKFVERVVFSYDDTVDMTNDIVEIMNNRFDLLKKSGCRNYTEYNLKARRNMEPIILAIDEWADLILENSKIEKSVCSLSQKGRAAGISVILTTQRPSVKVVSGLIKASFSGRICLKVNSAIDSRIVLDSSGAESITDIGVGMYKDHKNYSPRMFRSFYIESIDNEVGPSRPRLIGLDRLRGFRA